MDKFTSPKKALFSLHHDLRMCMGYLVERMNWVIIGGVSWSSWELLLKSQCKRDSRKIQAGIIAAFITNC